MSKRRSLACLVPALWLLASAGALVRADRAAPPGQLVASTTAFGSVGDPEMLYVHRIEQDGVVELHRETLGTQPVELAWADARTLWVMYGPRDDRSLELATFVDGQRASSRVMAAAEWGDLPGFSPHLHATVGGQIWLETCADGAASPQKGVPSRCRKHAWRRLDADAMVGSKAPQKVVKESRGARRALGKGLSASYRGRELEEMRRDPKPYEGEWTIRRGRVVLGAVPGGVLKVAPAKAPR
jgi:hypothetical protein